MRFLLTPILAALLTILVLTSPVQAKMAARCSKGQPAKHELVCGQKNLWHAHGALRFLRNHPQAGSEQSRARLHRDMLWLKKYAAAHINYAKARMLPAHYAGWSCITHGAYPGAPHEGNGYNGIYTGPLGMTTPWLGHTPPGSDWVHSSVSAVYKIAEQEAEKHGFSYGFMKGQWPKTYPPCASLF